MSDNVVDLAQRAQRAQERAGAIPYQGAPVWDERRNTSQTRPPDPMALENALEATAAFRRNYPRMAAWIAAGCPTIRTDDDHLRWFGVPYERGKLT